MIDVGDFTLGADFAAIVESVSASEPQVNLGSLDLAEKTIPAPVNESIPVLESKKVKGDGSHSRLCGGISPLTGHGGFSMMSSFGVFRS